MLSILHACFIWRLKRLILLCQTKSLHTFVERCINWKRKLKSFPYANLALTLCCTHANGKTFVVLFWTHFPLHVNDSRVEQRDLNDKRCCRVFILASSDILTENYNNEALYLITILYLGLWDEHKRSSSTFKCDKTPIHLHANCSSFSFRTE